MAELLREWFWKDNLKHSEWKARVHVYRKDKALPINWVLRASLIGDFSASGSPLPSPTPDPHPVPLVSRPEL